MQMAVDGQRLVSLPSPDGRHMTIEISGDFLPRVETLSARIQFGCLWGPRLSRHVISSTRVVEDSATVHVIGNENFRT
jgi:hypothetical protein